MAIRGLHHVSISVPSLSMAKDFYIGLLGFEEAMNFEWRDSAMMDTITALRGTSGKMAFINCRNLLLEIFEFESPTQGPAPCDPPPNRYGYTHLCFDVDDAFVAYSSLKDKGVIFLSEPVVTDEVVTVYGRDPFGNIVEFQQIKSPDIPSTIDC